jgi:hypothetical protein
LDVDHRVLGGELPGHGADDAEGDGRLEAQGAAEGEHELSRAQRVGIGERERRQRPRVHPQHGQVRFAVDGHDLGADGAAAAGEDGSPRRPAGRGEGQFHLQPRRVLDDVGVGDDVAVRIHDHAGAAAALQDGIPAAAELVLPGGRIAGHEDLDDARADVLGEVLQRAGQVAERGCGGRRSLRQGEVRDEEQSGQAGCRG